MTFEAWVINERKAAIHDQVAQAWDALGNAIQDPNVGNHELDGPRDDLLDAISCAEEWGIGRLVVFDQMAKALT